MDAVTNAVYLVLLSCRQIKEIKMESGAMGKSARSLFAELQGGPNAKARCYDVILLARQSLEAITSHLTTVTLLSARVQKEENGYNLRSSIACAPDCAKDKICW